MIFPYFAKASESILARIGDKYYDSLELAIAAAGPNDTINLVADVVLKNSQNINKTVNINLNGHTISSDNSVFKIEGGSLNLTGSGTIKETKPYYGAVVMTGSTKSNDESYSTLNVGEDVVLEGWSGVFVDHLNNKSYGVVANIEGTINSILDTNGDPGAGVYINGLIQHKDNYPIVTFTEKSKITSLGNGIYVAGYTKVNINGAYIEGKESALAIKSGIININSGTIICDGSDETPTTPNSNGINASGTAIQIESNNGYAGDINLNIKDGHIESKNSNTIYEYTKDSSTQTKVNHINISGGKFISGNEKTVFLFSNSFKNNISNFITGGEFKTDPSAYLKTGYSVVTSNGYFEVVKSTFKTENVNVSNDIPEKSSNFIPIILAVIILVSLIALIYVKKYRKKVIQYRPKGL